MALIYCKHCGHKISDKATLCPHCGSPSKDGQSQNIQNQQFPASVPSHEVLQKPQYVAQEASHSSNAKWWIVVIVIILLVAGIGFVGYNHIALRNKNIAIDTLLTDTLAADSTVVSSEETPKQKSAGLTFNLFTEQEEDSGKKFYLRLANDKIAANLIKLGFELVDRTDESRRDYTGEEYYNVTIETFSKAVDGNTTTVKLDEDFSEIHFPNKEDVKEFEQTLQKTRLKKKGDVYEDNTDVYWAGTDVKIKGTIVKLDYKWEP